MTIPAIIVTLYLKETWNSITSTINYDSHFSPSFGSWIDLHYEKLFMEGIQRKAMSGKSRNWEEPPIHSLFFLLKLCGIFLTLCVGTVIGEIIWSKYRILEIYLFFKRILLRAPRRHISHNHMQTQF